MRRQIIDFETIKKSVSMRQVLEHYGIEVKRNNIALCPFHPDTEPSMHVYHDGFYCFSCGTGGDVIKFVALLQGVKNTQAAQIVAGIGGLAAVRDDYRTRARLRQRAQERRMAEDAKNRLSKQYDALCGEIRRLRAQSYEEPFSDPWCEAMMLLPRREAEADLLFRQLGEFDGIHERAILDGGAVC